VLALALARWSDAAPPGWVRPAPDAAMRRVDVAIGLLLAVGGMLSVVLGRAAGVDRDTHPAAVGEGIGW
jgi:hypothetical protein